MEQIGLDEVIASFKRCDSGGHFIDRFYQRFVAASPEVAAKFEHTDFSLQKQALRESLLTLLAGAEIPETGVIRQHMDRIARRHAADELDIRPELYELWLDCLVAAVEEQDPQYTPALGRAWREALRPGIEFMQTRY